MKMHFIDFDDSFSWNIIAEIEQLNIVVEIHHCRCLSHYGQDKIQQLIDEPLLLGPGPGHPSEYKNWIKLIQQKMNQSKVLFGICLGHQLIGLALGGRLKQIPQPRHGISTKVCIPKWDSVFENKDQSQDVQVQWYNSWVLEQNSLKNIGINVSEWSDEEGIIGLCFENGFSLQFHPESIGTSYPSIFFNGLLKTLYNSKNEKGLY